MIGSSLEPTLSSAIDVLARVSKTTIDWIARNKTLIVTVFKVAVAIAAGGAALIAIGAAASAIGTGLAAAAAIIARIGKAFAIVGTMIAALLTPLGLTIVGVGALAAYLLYATGAGSKALQWLSDRFIDRTRLFLAMIRLDWIIPTSEKCGCNAAKSRLNADGPTACVQNRRLHATEIYRRWLKHWSGVRYIPMARRLIAAFIVRAAQNTRRKESTQ